MPLIYLISDKLTNEELVAVSWCNKRTKKEIEEEVRSLINYYNSLDNFCHISRAIVSKETYLEFNGKYEAIK